MEMKVELITPEIAARYLKHNTDNYRRISKSKVALYAQEMIAGKWQLNGEGIVFDKAGTLKNGQHRLAAIMVAGKPIEMTVIRGVDEAVAIYDTGMMRSTSQIAQASGCGDITTTESAVATAIVGKFNSISKGQVIAWLQKHGDEVKRAARICGAGTSRNLSRRASAVLATFLMIRLKGMKSFECEVFFKAFNSGNTIGTDGYEPSPALVARRMFETTYKTTGGRSIREQVEVLLMAMTDFQKSKTRQMNYQIREPLNVLTMVDEVRKADGLA